MCAAVWHAGNRDRARPERNAAIVGAEARRSAYPHHAEKVGRARLSERSAARSRRSEMAEPFTHRSIRCGMSKPVCVNCGKPYGHRHTATEVVRWDTPSKQIERIGG